MIKYKKIYADAFGYIQGEYVSSELSPNRGVDIHHIVGREERIENLIAVTREEHLKYGEVKSAYVFLLTKHMNFLEDNGVKFDYKWFEEQINKYSIYA